MKILLFSLVIAVSAAASLSAAPNPSDPALVLWLTPSGYNQNADTWRDSSSYGTILGGQGAGEAVTDPTNHTPQLVATSNNGQTFNAVNFRQAFDPVVRDNSFPDGHWSDRLYQRSNDTPGSNPLMLGGNLTMFVVFNAATVNGGLGPHSNQTIGGIRGPTGTPYNLSIFLATSPYTSGSHLGLVTYGGALVYQSSLLLPVQTDGSSGWGIAELKFSGDGTTCQIGQDFGSGMQWSDPMTVPRNAGTGSDAVYPTKDAPFSIACHSQANGGTTDNPYGGGTYERWAGQMGDFLVYNTALSSTAEADILSYLKDKYGIPTPVANDVRGLLLAPYVWKVTGTGSTARAEATVPGAYLKAKFVGSSTIGLVIDGSANAGCPASSMPVVEYAVDNLPLHIVQLTNTTSLYTLPMASGLNTGAQHELLVYFRAADLAQNRWMASTAHLRVAGTALDAGGSLLLENSKPGRVIGFGDSITEGVGVDGQFTSWQILAPNNARGTWLPIVCSALNCEYGQLGTGGQGMCVTGLAMPPLPQTWNYYDAGNSRLTSGLLVPEPDYVFCEMGSNDSTISSGTFISAYLGWLAAVRQASPHARIFCVTSPFGNNWHAADVRSIVTTRRASGDARIYLVDLASIEWGFKPTSGAATILTYDGGHPSLYGQALLGSLVTSQVQNVLSTKEQPADFNGDSIVDFFDFSIFSSNWLKSTR